MLENDISKLFGTRNKNSAPQSSTKLPVALPAAYWEPLEEAAPEAADDGLCHGDAVLEAESNYQFLAKLRNKALRKMDEILDVPLPDEEDADYARVMSIQKDVSTNILNASLKADENCFRQRRNDALDRLFTAVEAALAEQPTAPVIDHVAP